MTTGQWIDIIVGILKNARSPDGEIDEIALANSLFRLAASFLGSGLFISAIFIAALALEREIRYSVAIPLALVFGALGVWGIVTGLRRDKDEAA